VRAQGSASGDQTASVWLEGVHRDVHSVTSITWNGVSIGRGSDRDNKKLVCKLNGLVEYNTSVGVAWGDQVKTKRIEVEKSRDNIVTVSRVAEGERSA